MTARGMHRLSSSAGICCFNIKGFNPPKKSILLAFLRNELGMNKALSITEA